MERGGEGLCTAFWQYTALPRPVPCRLRSSSRQVKLMPGGIRREQRIGLATRNPLRTRTAFPFHYVSSWLHPPLPDSLQGSESLLSRTLSLSKIDLDLEG